MAIFISGRKEIENLIINMHVEGKPIRKIAHYLKIGRNTVRQIIRRHNSERDNYPPSPLPKKTIARLSKLDLFIPKIKELIVDFPNITGERILEEIKKDGYVGGRSILNARLRFLRPKPKKEPVVRFETAAGLQGQMDWSPYTIPFTRTGKMKLQCFSYVLGYSRRQYIDFTTDRKFHTLIRRHQDAFKYFSGVPHQCLYDGEKTIILRWESGKPIFNPSFIAFITHYRCRPIACWPKRPQTKGKVERPFQYVEGNLLNGRKFQDLEDLRSTAKWWMENVSDIHPHGTTGRPPIELFMEEEINSLEPLPANHYDTSEVALLLCNFEGTVRFETNRYTVPYNYVGEIMALKATDDEIFIYSPDLQLVAHHQRAQYGMNEKIEDPGHRISKIVRYGIEPVRQQFIDLGDGAEEFLLGLENKPHCNGGYHLRYILHLKEHYLAENINKALRHAITYYAFDCKAVERILKTRFKKRTLESIRNERANEILRKTIPIIKQRPLLEYSSLFDNQGEDNEYDGTDQSASENTEFDHNGQCT